MTRVSTVERLLARNTVRNVHNGCLVWTGNEGKVVMHLCNNRSCVEVSHLKIGTTLENNRYLVESGTVAHSERHPGTKLTIADVHRIKALAKEGVPRKDIAQEYGYTVSGIRHILAGLSWKHHKEGAK